MSNHQSIHNYFAWPTVTRLKDGTIICHIRMDDVFTLYQTESCDGGKTWANETVISPDLECHDIGYPSTIELSDGSLITVFYSKQNGGSEILQQKWELEI